MSDERLEILRMVGDKKISVEEAERLLRAVEERERRSEREERGGHGFGAFFDIGKGLQGIGDLVRTTVEEAVTGVGFGWDLEHDGLEEVAVREGKFEIPAGSQLVVRQRYKGDVEVVADSDVCRVDGPIASLARGKDRFVLRLDRPRGKATRVQVPPGLSELKVIAMGGNIRAVGLACPSTIRTMGGDLALLRLKEPFEAHSMGGRLELELHPELAGDSSAQTMGGDVDVVVPGGLRARIKVSTMGGRMDVEPELGTVSRDMLGVQKAVIETGTSEPRVEVKVKTMGGNVRVRRANE